LNYQVQVSPDGRGNIGIHIQTEPSVRAGVRIDHERTELTALFEDVIVVTFIANG
jgi:hypothetical protein